MPGEIRHRTESCPQTNQSAREERADGPEEDSEGVENLPEEITEQREFLLCRRSETGRYH